MSGTAWFCIAVVMVTLVAFLAVAVYCLTWSFRFQRRWIPKHEWTFYITPGTGIMVHFPQTCTDEQVQEFLRRVNGIDQ